MKLASVAPTLAADAVKAYYMRPLMSSPPLCTLTDLKSGLTIDDVADFHEILNAREAATIAQRDVKTHR